MATHQPAKVLIVEDSKVFRRALKSMLRSRFPLVEVFEAEDAAEGRRKSSQLAPELVFIDVQLPDGNGLVLAEQIKNDYPHTRVVVCTSYDLAEYREAATRCGAVHFMPKDRLFVDEMWEPVEGVLRRAQARGSDG